MAKSCKGLAAELVKCLSESDCVTVENRPFRDCAKEQSPCISSECVGLRETYFNCKRGQCTATRKYLVYAERANTQSCIKLLKGYKKELRTTRIRFYSGQSRISGLGSLIDMRARIRGNKGY